VIDALTIPADATIIRTMMESMYLMYGAVALFLMALMMVIAGYAGVASRALPAWTGRLAYVCALACLAFVPTMFVGHPDPNEFYNPADWGPLAIAPECRWQCGWWRLLFSCCGCASLRP
jgi:hypothetical protein